MSFTPHQCKGTKLCTVFVHVKNYYCFLCSEWTLSLFTVTTRIRKFNYSGCLYLFMEYIDFVVA